MHTRAGHPFRHGMQSVPNHRLCPPILVSRISSFLKRSATNESNTRALVAQVEAVARTLGQPFNARGVGYGSDGNNLAEVGMQLLVGVGPFGGGMHSDKEYMLLSSYRDRLNLTTALINKLLTTERVAP